MLLASPAAVDEARLEAGEVLPLRTGARIGTSAARRQAQIHDLRPDLVIGDLRGNVPTRVGKLRDGQHDAILLACAGLKRLELDVSDLFTKPLAVAAFVPAPGQGVLGIQCAADSRWRDDLRQLQTEEAACAVRAERDLLARLEGGCQLPFGVHATATDDTWRLELFLARTPADERPLRISLQGDALEPLVETAWDRITAFRKEDA
jgi:hydroxymethylbilane synthase